MRSGWSGQREVEQLDDVSDVRTRILRSGE